MEQAQRAPRNGGQVKRIVGKIVLQFVIATSHHLQIPHVLMLASNLILQINSTEFCGLNSNHGQYAIIQMPKNRICSTAYVVNDQSATCFPVIRTRDATAIWVTRWLQKDVAKLHPNRMIATKPERPYGTRRIWQDKGGGQPDVQYLEIEIKIRRFLMTLGAELKNERVLVQ